MSKHYLWLASVLLTLAACEKSFEEPADLDSLLEEEDPWLFTDLLGQVQVLKGPVITISADFAGTRSQIRLNEDETSAATVWTARDQFSMIGYDSENSARRALFQTDEGGISAVFTTSDYLPNPPPYYATYPPVKAFAVSKSDGKYLLSVNLPSEQPAVPHGFTEGYAIAYTEASSMTADLHFESQVSLVRFRMSGSLVSQVRTVSIVGAKSLAGNAIIVADPSSGSYELTQDRDFNGDVHYNTVNLTGTFQEGLDYYIVVYPGTQPGFMMVFADEEGHSTTKFAPEFTFPRSEISDFGTINLGDAFTDSTDDMTPILYMSAKESTGATKPVTIAVIPEGFTAQEMTKYEMLAESGIDALMNTEPYKSYKDYFNVWILKAASNQSGASITDANGNMITERDCYFESKWGETTYKNMQANETKVYRFVSENCPDIVQGIHPITEVPILMIINDPRYGGICHGDNHGRGFGMVPYTDDGGVLSWSYPAIVPKSDERVQISSDQDLKDNSRQTTDAEFDEVGHYVGDWRNTLVHEFGGHCFGRLGDEYWSTEPLLHADDAISSHTWEVPLSLNLAADPSDVPWSALMDLKADLMAHDPRYGRIGIFQGGERNIFGRWRSEKVSCMIDNRCYFSTWQRMLIVKRIMSLSGSLFNEEDFWRKDVAVDPVRDVSSSRVMDSHPLQVRTVPQLPSPVLHE